MNIDKEDTAINELVNRSPVSVRLMNCIRRAATAGQLPFRTVRDYLAAGEQGRFKMLRLQGMGLKMLHEFDELMRNGVLVRSGRDVRDRSMTVQDANKDVKDVGNGLLTGPELDQSSIDLKPADIETEDVDLEGVISALSEREADIVRCRYGFGGNHVETLESIGHRLNLTRERVRQIEARTLNRLRRQTTQTRIKRYIANHIDDAWRSLATRSGVIRKVDISRLRKKLPGEFLLAIDVAFGDIRNWLKRVSTPIEKCFYRGPLESSKLRDVCHRLKEVLSAWPDARPLLAVARRATLTSDEAETAADILADASVYNGYVVRGRITKRIKRCIRLHSMLITREIHETMSTSALLEMYREHYVDDRCTARDIEIVMSASPHLFLQMYELGWAALAPRLNRQCLKIESVDADEEFLEPEVEREDRQRKEQQSIADILYGLLTEKGPLRFTALRELFRAHSQGRHSANSVGPILLAREEFVRLAPGIYGTSQQRAMIDDVNSVAEQLLDERQCRLYCMGRWAGEGFGSYPLWTPGMEHAWTRWAEIHATKETFESLLAVITPEHWPVSEKERAYWIRMKQSRARYQLQDGNPPAMIETPPELLDILAGCLLAKQAEKLNWMSANRVVGRRLDDAHVRALLALLVGIGALVPAQHWQQSHKTVPVRLDDVVSQLSANAFDNGLFRPSEETVALLLNSEGSAVSLGWVNEQELDQLRDCLRELWTQTQARANSKSRQKGKGTKGLRPLGSLDRALQVHRQKKIAERLLAEA